MDSRAPLKTCGHKLRGMTERREQWDALLDQSRVSASDERNEQRRYPTDSQWDSGETLNVLRLEVKVNRQARMHKDRIDRG